jgi:hypothetical protein
MLMLFAGAANAQAPQGTITYNLEVQNSPLASMMGDMQITLYYKNSQVLTDMRSQLYSMKTLITDSGTLTLLSTMGQKMFFKTAVAKPSGLDEKMPVVVYTNETKQIAGYTCNKALIIANGGQAVDTSVFWYTEQLPLIAFGKAAFLIKGLKGMPLEYEINIPQMKMKVTAQSVSTGELHDSTFLLSTDGYTEFDAGTMLKQFQP